MTEIILDRPSLVAKIRDQFQNINQLKYKRALQEFFDDDGAFIGDNVVETSFKIRAGLPPLVYEVSGPYDSISNEYATLGRIYESGERVFEADIKQQIQQRTAAMIWLFFAAIGHKPNKVLMVGAGKLATETVRYLKYFMPGLSEIDYHARNRRKETFELACGDVDVNVTFRNDILSRNLTADISKKKNVLRITGTPMQNVAVLDMMRGL